MLPTSWNCFSFWSSGQLQRPTPRPEPKGDPPAVALLPMKNAGSPEANVESRLRPGMPASAAGVVPEVSRQDLDAVVEATEAEVGEQRVDEIAQSTPYARLWLRALEMPPRSPARPPPPAAEDLRAVAEEIAEAVTAERIQAVAQPAVDAHVEGVAVEGLRARTRRSC